MRHFLVLRLQGPMQAWGGHTYEDYRPTLGFPTRSALLGLLGACLGVRREDPEAQLALSRSLRFAVRIDGHFSCVSDFHTVMKARKVDGKVREDPVLSPREYLIPQDPGASFAVAAWETQDATVTLANVVEAIRRPVFTPTLGRRSCPLSRPLYEAEIQAPDPVTALDQTPPSGGPIYSEEGDAETPQLRLRDEPIIVRPRQFASRKVYIHNTMQDGGDDVSQ